MINEYEDFALGSFLCDWNRNATYNDTIEALKHDIECHAENCDLCPLQDDIIVWEPFENRDYSYVAEQIENMKESLEHRFIPREAT